LTLTIATFALLVDDYDRGIAYFRDVIGLTVAEDTPLPGGKRWVVMTGAGGARMLLARAEAEQRAAIGNQTAGRVGFFLETNDFAAEHARLAAAGVRFLEMPRHEEYGTVVVFEDAFGNRWDLIQPSRPSA
jgi:catechol 2,3-dioxygenase-like lactoylglutathione lyase family enzyme